MAKAILKLNELEEYVTGTTEEDHPVPGGKPGETRKVKVEVKGTRNKVLKLDLPAGYESEKEALNALVRGHGGKVLEASIEGAEPVATVTRRPQPGGDRRPA